MSDSAITPGARALFSAHAQALLALADGTVLRGRAIGAMGHATGEVVFNTAMTGYQEIVTDPSYAGQIVTLTCPHIGNVGANADDAESRRIFAAGALRAARFIAGARQAGRTGLFDMADVLGMAAPPSTR